MAAVALALLCAGACVRDAARAQPAPLPAQATAQSRSATRAGPARRTDKQGPEPAGCPKDPEAAQQRALLPGPDAPRWPAEVRLRFRVLAGGGKDCIYLVGATQPGFVPECLEMLRKLPERRGREARDRWRTFLCQFDPKAP